MTICWFTETPADVLLNIFYINVFGVSLFFFLSFSLLFCVVFCFALNLFLPTASSTTVSRLFAFAATTMLFHFLHWFAQRCLFSVKMRDSCLVFFFVLLLACSLLQTIFSFLLLGLSLLLLLIFKSLFVYIKICVSVLCFFFSHSVAGVVVISRFLYARFLLSAYFYIP